MAPLGAGVGPGLFLVVMFATHLTPIYDDALGNRWLHESEHAAYLLSACAMWAAVVGVRRTGAAARVAVVYGVIALSSFLGLILMASARPLMPTYEARLGFDRALSDQRSAAALDVGHRPADDGAAAGRRRLALGVG